MPDSSMLDMTVISGTPSSGLEPEKGTSLQLLSSSVRVQLFSKSKLSSKSSCNSRAQLPPPFPISSCYTSLAFMLHTLHGKKKLLHTCLVAKRRNQQPSPEFYCGTIKIQIICFSSKQCYFLLQFSFLYLKNNLQAPAFLWKMHTGHYMQIMAQEHMVVCCYHCNTKSRIFHILLVMSCFVRHQQGFNADYSNSSSPAGFRRQPNTQRRTLQKEERKRVCVESVQCELRSQTPLLSCSCVQAALPHTRLY